MAEASAASRSFNEINVSVQELLLLEMTSLIHRISKPTPKSTTNIVTMINAESEVDGEEELSEPELIISKLDSIGYRVGRLLVEQYTRNGPIFYDHLDIIKFVCRDLWITLYGKQMDNLKTNHKGVFVLTDHKFRWYFKHLSLNPAIPGGAGYRTYLWFPCGIIRGALASLGMDCTVTAECANGPPSTAFQIKTINRPEN